MNPFPAGIPARYPLFIKNKQKERSHSPALPNMLLQSDGFTSTVGGKPRLSGIQIGGWYVKSACMKGLSFEEQTECIVDLFNCSVAKC